MCRNISYTRGENTKDIVIKAGSLIRLDITGNDISVSHRLSKPSYSAAIREGPQASSNTCNIVVKFVRREMRDRFYKGGKLLQDKWTWDLDPARYSENKIYISENLTEINEDLFLKSLKVKRDLKYKYIWTFHGHTYLWKDSASTIASILKKSDLDISVEVRWWSWHSSSPNLTG